MPTQQLVRHLSLAWKRLARVVFVFLLLGGGLQGQESARNVLVVVPPRGATAQGREVEQVVDMLKAARKELGLKSQELPILRLSLRQERPAQVLQALGINATGNPQVLLCRRGSDGWPELLLGQLSGGENPLLFVRSAVRDPERRELPSRDDEPVLPPRQEVSSRQVWRVDRSPEKTSWRRPDSSACCLPIVPKIRNSSNLSFQSWEGTGWKGTAE